MKSILLGLLLIHPFLESYADEPQKQCEVSVKYFYKTGASDTKTYPLFANSKKDCERKSESYKTNATPNKIKKKEVSIKWSGK